MTMNDCTKARQAIDARVDGELGVAEEADLRTHLSTCASCAHELEERSAFSDSLQTSLRESLKSVHASAEERRALVDRLAKPRLVFAPRLAAAVAIAATIGILAYSSGFLRKSPAPAPTAERETRARYERLLADIERMTEEVRAQLPANGEATEADWTAAMELATLEDQVSQIAYPQSSGDGPVDLRARIDAGVRGLGGKQSWIRAGARRNLRSLPAEAVADLEAAMSRAPAGDRWFVRELIEQMAENGLERQGKVVIRKKQGDRQVEFQQFGDAQVELFIVQNGRPRKIQARNVADLLRRHRDTCREYSIAGGEGWITVGGIASAMDLKGQLGLLFRSREAADFAPVRREAYAKVLSKRVQDGGELETRLKAMEEKFLQAEEEVSEPDTGAREFRRILARLTALKGYVEAVQAAKK